MKKLTLLITLLISVFTFSQIHFENGYFIDNSGNKVSCLIRNSDWKNNPTRFDYKLTADSEVKVATLKEVKEFAIPNEIKFIRETVMIDRSTDNLNALNYDKEPTYVEEQIFLKQIATGKANLYQYVEPNFLRFFYSTENGKIEQLIYKRYQIDYNSVTYNEGFKDQIEKNMICSVVNPKRIDQLKYRADHLKNLFLDYNRCVDPSFVTVAKEVKKGVFHISIRPHINFNSFNATDNFFKFDTKLSSKTAFSAGIEAEYIFPFNKNKWSLILEPTYEYYKDEGIQDAAFISGGKLITTVNYSSVVIPIGFRHYMYLNQDSRLFVNVLYAYAIKLGENVQFKRSDNSVFRELPIFPKSNFAFGFGYNFKEKYGIEFRYSTPRKITADGGSYISEFNNSSLILSYTLF